LGIILEKQKEEKLNLILRKYIPLLKNHYMVHELKKEHLLKDIDHKECFIIKDGSVLARDKSGKTTTLEKGTPIGFAEALVSRPYDLTYILKEDTIVFAFKSSEIRKAFLTASSLTRGITRYTLDRVFENNKSKTYHLIDDGFLSKQQDKFPLKDYSDGDTIFMRNQKPKFFFYVDSGKVQLVSKEEKIIATFNDGDSFGENALFTNTLRSVTAKSVGNTTLQLVSAEFIKNYFDNEDLLVKFCLVSILERLKAMNNLRNLVL
jgi:CRP-like cAMP-binding protein